MMLIEDIEKLCEQAGVRPSPVRSLVVRELDTAPGPISAQDIENSLETVDRSSITRTLSLFLQHGLVHAVDDGSGSIKYELCRSHASHDNDSDLHAHFHCTRCGTTYCLDTVPMPIIQLSEGFIFQSANYVIKGICPKCNNVSPT